MAAKRSAPHALNIRLTEDDRTAWEAVKAKHSGSPSKAFRAMLSAEQGRNDIDLPAALRRAADELEERSRPKWVGIDPAVRDIEVRGSVAESPQSFPAPILSHKPQQAGKTDELRQIGEQRAASRFSKQAKPPSE